LIKFSQVTEEYNFSGETRNLNNESAAICFVELGIILRYNKKKKTGTYLDCSEILKKD